MTIRSNTDERFYYEFDKFLPPIGEGGMGVVYKGEMINMSNNSRRDVAIKEICVEGDASFQSAAIERARREASIRIKHDNIVEMIDFIEVSDTRFGVNKVKYYVVSEFLNGVNLNNVILGKCENYEGKPIEFAKEIYDKFVRSREETSYWIIKNVLAAITTLHDNGYIHRDIDPSNLMVTDDGKLKLIDFGIAERLDELRAASVNVSENGAFVGKVEYAAPELLKGDLSQQGFPTDIYAIGVLFFELLVGRLPFSGTSYDIMQGHQYKKPPLDYIKDKRYRSVVAKAMNKYPEMRYSTSSEMRVALEGDKNPRPVNWKWPLTIFAVTVIAVISLVLLRNKKNTIPPNPDDLINSTVIVHTNIVNVDSLKCLTLDDLWAKLNEEPDNAAILYFISVSSKGKNLKNDKRAQDYYNTLKLEGYTEKCLERDKEFTSVRFVYLIACKALEELEKDSSRYPDGFKEEIIGYKKSLSIGQKNFRE